jgi:ABC-2 type transport system ATP-binding protein
MFRRLLAPTAVLLVLFALTAPGAEASRDGYITSFDGTKIVYSFMPATGLKPGDRAPTVMVGPGYSSGHATSSDPEVSALLAAGYNVLTWDPRGFGDSGGNVEIDSPNYEARDAMALIDFLAKQPEVQLDKPGDPRLGMAGMSYGGGIQWVTAAQDPRVDVIAPQISWHSLVTSLDKANTAKGGWGSILFGLGVEGTTVPGVTGGVSGQPAGFQFGRVQDPAANQALLDGVATGGFTPADQAFFAARGPDFMLSHIHVPTLMLQGTSDTLFTLKEAIDNYAAIRGNGIPFKMTWFCGSLTNSDGSIAHGICQTNQGNDPAVAVHQTVAWMNRYLKGDTSVSTGPRFEWISQDGVDHGAADYPPPAGQPIVASGSGTLVLTPGDTSGELIAAAPAVNGVDVSVPAPAGPTQIVGEPSLTLDYSGTAPQPDARIYAQLIDNATNQAVGPVVTPVPLTLDGQQHTLTIPLEAVALDATPQSSYRLQLTDGTTVYFAARQPGVVTFSHINLSLPTVAADSAASDTVTSTPAAKASRPALRLAAHPGRTTVGCRQLKFMVTTRSSGHYRRVPGASVNFRGHRVRTGRTGTAVMRTCLRRSGNYVASAHRTGYRSASATIRALTAARRRSPQFTG